MRRICIMLKDFTIANMLDMSQTIAGELFEGKTYPWEVLPEIGDFILKLGQTLSEEEYDHPSEDVWIAKSAKVAPTACINGPVIIGKEAEVRHCAFIRGKAIVGEGAVVGNSTELKNAVLFNKVQVPHYNYVGDAVLGYKSHMGAGSICSNVTMGDIQTIAFNHADRGMFSIWQTRDICHREWFIIHDSTTL